MTDAHTGGYAGATADHESGNAAAAAVTLLSLAAAPTFAVMAMLSALDVGPPDMLCATTQQGSPLDGMTAMYLLMSAFHSAPWLRLISGRRNSARRASAGRAPSQPGRILSSSL
jgi:hypothetical protein